MGNASMTPTDKDLEQIHKADRAWYRSSMIRFLALSVFVSVPVYASDPPLLPGAQVTSIYWSDADSGRINGVPFRLHGVDAPETGGVGSRGGAKCEPERVLGFEAKEWMVETTKGADMAVTAIYEKDQYDRWVVDLSIDGEALSSVSVASGHLRTWDYDGGEAKPKWCAE